MESKILRGIQSRKEFRSYLASIRKYEEHICGGSLISTLHILTAASCVILFKDEKPYNEYSVVVGAINPANDGIHCTIFHIETNNDFRVFPWGQSHSDIALITVSKTI